MKLLLFALFLNFSLWADTIGVVGSGYVGLVMSGMLAKWGHQVICIDKESEKIEALKNNILPIFEPGLADLLKEKSHQIHFSKDISQLNNLDLVYICVGTPQDPKGSCDTSAICLVLNEIQTLDNPPATVCIKSTIAPGTLRALSKTLKKPLKLVYNPEFMREGSALNDICFNNPIVIGSFESSHAAVIKNVYSQLIQENPTLEVFTTSPETAELIKYGWNGFSAIRIAYMNELSHLCNHYCADIETLTRGIAWSEKLLPTEHIKPGCGYGGSCLPKDSLALSVVFEKIGLQDSIVKQAISSNKKHLKLLIEQTLLFMGQVKTIGVIGASFKANTDDIREAPSIPIIQSLLDKGYKVRVFDPHAFKRLHDTFPKIQIYSSIYEALKGCDGAIILHDCEEIRTLDLDRVLLLMKRPNIADLKNVFSTEALKSKGFNFINLGKI